MAREGYIPYRGFRTWYRIVGDKEDSGKLPLLCLHGGPGAPHDYLQPLEGLANTGRRVVFYDQLGCGNSDHPHDRSLWTVPFFVEELGTVRDILGLDQVHLLGNSWGGMLAMEYALTKPAGLKSLILSSSPVSMPQWAAETRRLRSQLPRDVREALDAHEKAGTLDDPAYVNAVMEFYRRHVCRVDPWPDYVTRTFEKLTQDPEVYNTMNGPNEFTVTGSLRAWDITRRLGEFRIPTLITSGRYDEATPAIAKLTHESIRGSEWALFENSSHMAFVEETDRYLKTVADFLARVEARR